MNSEDLKPNSDNLIQIENMIKQQVTQDKKELCTFSSCCP